jgi:hypothetical protein
LLLQTFNKQGVLLDPKTGRPKMEPPFDRPGVLKSYADPAAELRALPGHVLESLDKAGSASSLSDTPQGSAQGWEELLYAPLADGTAVTGSAEATMVPIFTLPANYLYPGRILKWTVMGRQSTAITTPGTITLRLAYSATGLGAVVMAASGAFAPDPTAAATNLTFMVEWWTICRSSGVTGTGLSWGWIHWADYDDASAAAVVANLGMEMAPVSAPAVATIDTTVARALNPTYQSSVATGSMTAHGAFLESLT